MSNPLKKIGKAVKGFVSSIGNFVKKHWKKILVIGAMVAAPYMATQMAAAGAGVGASAGAGIGGIGASAGAGIAGSAATGAAATGAATTGAAAGAVTTGVTGLGSVGNVPLTEAATSVPEIGATTVSNSLADPGMMNTISEMGTAVVQGTGGESVSWSSKMFGWLRDKTTGDGMMSKLFGKALEVGESAVEWFKKSDWAKLGAMNWMKSYGEMKAQADALAAKPKYRGSVFGVDARGQVWNPETDSMVQATPDGRVPGEAQYSPYTPPAAQQGARGVVPAPTPMQTNSQEMYQQVASYAPQVGQETMSDDPSVVSAEDFAEVPAQNRGLIQFDMNRRLG